MMAVTHEQFSVLCGHKIITQFINKMINEIGGNMKSIVPAEIKKHRHLRFAKK